MDHKDRQLQALRERVKELERRGDALERECARLEAKLSRRQLAIVAARLAEHDLDRPLQ
jgi:hypothetical protein